MFLISSEFFNVLGGLQKSTCVCHAELVFSASVRYAELIVSVKLVSCSLVRFCRPVKYGIKFLEFCVF